MKNNNHLSPSQRLMLAAVLVGLSFAASYFELSGSDQFLKAAMQIVLSLIL